MRILILRGGALGDFIVTLPALHALRAKWPGAHIELIGNATAAALGAESGLLNQVHSQHNARWAPLYSDSPLPGELTRWLDGFDTIVSYWPDPDGVLVRRLSESNARVLPHPGTVISAPAARHFCAPLAALGVTATTFESVLTLSAESETLGNNLTAPLGPFIAVHAGSGSPRKTWRFDRWTGLLHTLGWPFVAVSGEADASLPEWPAEIRPVLQLKQAPLNVVAAVLKAARLYIGHDTGVSHLAAAVGTPSVLLFGPTAPAVWAPPGLHVRIVKTGESLDALSINQVEPACRALLENAAAVLRPRRSVASADGAAEVGAHAAQSFRL